VWECGDLLVDHLVLVCVGELIRRWESMAAAGRWRWLPRHLRSPLGWKQRLAAAAMAVTVVAQNVVC
jgi:hypothetical protein